MSAAVHVAIRPATAADATAIAAIKVTGWATTYAGLMADEILQPFLDPAAQTSTVGEHIAASNDIVLVAETADTGAGLVGFAICMHGDGDVPLLDSLHVLPELRGGRVGQQLMRHLADALIHLGHTSLTLHVIEGNDRACRFYERLGGQPTTRQPASFAAAVTDITYQWTNLGELQRLSRDR